MILDELSEWLQLLGRYEFNGGLKDAWKDGLQPGFNLFLNGHQDKPDNQIMIADIGGHTVRAMSGVASFHYRKILISVRHVSDLAAQKTATEIYHYLQDKNVFISPNVTYVDPTGPEPLESDGLLSWVVRATVEVRA